MIQDLSELLVLEQGKSTAFAQGEVALVNEWFERMPGMEIEEKVVWEDDSTRAIEQYVPLGVTAGIVPVMLPSRVYGRHRASLEAFPAPPVVLDMC